MADAGRLTIASSDLAVDVATVGAEMQDLRDGEGRSLQWDGDPAVWSGRAPLLFPIVGELAGGRYRWHGREYALPRHGFARRSMFDVVAHDPRSVVLRLSANDATRAVYPFAFALDLAYTIDAATLSIAATITNHGDGPMPASIGFHPAFRWPLPFGQPRDDHAIVFERPEPAPMRRLDRYGLLEAQSLPTPIVGRTLALRDALFADDALIFDRLASRRVRYGASRGPCLDIRFDGLPLLGVWTKPHGAGFVCIEPWHGVADAVGFEGDLAEKPGIVLIGPRESRVFTMTIEVVARADDDGFAPSRE